MKKHVITAVAFFMLLLAACSQKEDAIIDSSNNQLPNTQVPSEVKATLDQYAEPEDFNWQEIITAQSDLDFSDINDSVYDAYLVTFLWGKLLNMGTPMNVAYTWDGSLSVNGPSIVQTLAPIDFEHGEDSMLADNQTNSESWGSFTDNEFDGVLFLVLYDKVTPTFAPQVLTFSTPPISIEFNFDQLAHLFAYYQVDAQNGVAIAAHRIRIHNCREGYLDGHWEKSDSSEFTGTFQGLWFAANGDTVGIYSGSFFKTNDGAQLLDGWISGLYTDEIIAELHGVWQFDDYRMCPLCGYGHGWFKGRFQMSNSDEHGFFRGEFGDFSLPPDDRIMPMHGKWLLDCVNVVIDDHPQGN
jgi:hypothetical protein